jgi:hypothetical protein
MTEMELVPELYRRYLMRLMYAASLEHQSPCARQSGLEMKQVIMQMWESHDYIYAEWLKPCLLVMTQHLERFKPILSSGNITAE